MIRNDSGTVAAASALTNFYFWSFDFSSSACFKWNVSIGWTAMNFGPHNHAPLRMNCKTFGDSLTFPLATSSALGLQLYFPHQLNCFIIVLINRLVYKVTHPTQFSRDQAEAFKRLVLSDQQSKTRRFFVNYHIRFRKTENIHILDITKNVSDKSCVDRLIV